MEGRYPAWFRPSPLPTLPPASLSLPRHCGTSRNPGPPATRGDHRGATLHSVRSVCSVAKTRPPGRCLSPTPANVYSVTGIGSRKPLLEHRAPPGRGNTRIIMLVNHGGKATQPRAPGHDRPFAASLGAAEHGRLSAATRAPGADVPRATTARAPGQYCQSAAPRAPGHGRTLAIAAGLLCHDRLSAAPIATVPSPAGLRRLRQEGLPHTPANPRILTYLHTHPNTAHTRTTHAHHPNRHSRASGNPRPLSIAPRWRGGRGVRSTSHQAHPANQGPPHARSCSTAHTGFLRNHPSRAPPPRHCGAGRNPRPPPQRGDHRGASPLSPLHMLERGRG